MVLRYSFVVGWFAYFFLTVHLNDLLGQLCEEAGGYCQGKQKDCY